MRALLVVSTCILLTLASVTARAQPVPAFSDQTFVAGVTASHSPAYSHSYLAGGTVGDFNGDGWQDIYFPTGGNTPDRLFINDTDGTFTDRATSWGIAVNHRGTGAVAGDFDGDGWLDLFVTSQGPTSAAATTGQHRLYRNLGGTGFQDVAVAAGVNYSSILGVDGWGGAWGDYDLDGDLDLAVAGWSTSDGNRLFRNEGSGTFTDVTAAAGLATLTGISGFAPRFVDMDGDRFPELIWIGDFSTSRYYINDGDGTFTDFTEASGTSLDGTEMGSTVADWDEDGLFDFYVTTIGTNNLYINRDDHEYVNRANEAGVFDTAWGWGTVAIDFNHDTLVDIVTTSQTGGQFAHQNTTPSGGALAFTDVTNSVGLLSAVSGRGLSNLDYDNDGDQDLVIFPYAGPLRLFRNDLSGTDINWLRVLANDAGVDDVPPHGVGSVIKLTLGSRTLMGRIDGGSNYLSASEMSAHFGLGGATTVDEVRVEWTNGAVTVLTDVAANQTLVVDAESFAGFGPGEAVGLLATGLDAPTGDISISYDVACESAGHNIYYGPLSQVSSYGWSGETCSIGSSGTFDAFDPGAGSFFFVVVGHESALGQGDADEGSYGKSSAGERPPFAGNACSTVQDLVNACAP